MPRTLLQFFIVLVLATLANPLPAPILANEHRDHPLEKSAEELADPPREVQYLTRASGVTPYPMWVSLAAAAPDGETLLGQWFDEASIRAHEYFMSRPEEPEIGCTVVDTHWDVYGGLKSPETSGLVARVRIVHSEPGFGWGAPGTLFRGEVLEILKADAEHQDRQILDFFAPVGRIPFGDRVLCPRDHRFPDLQVGDEAILLASQIFSPDEPLIGVGEGGVLAIRDGKVLAEGAAYDRLGLTTLEGALALIRAAAAEPKP